MTRNFNLIWWFGIAEKELEKRIPQYKRKSEEILKKSEENFNTNLLKVALPEFKPSSNFTPSIANKLAKFLAVKDIIDRFYQVGIREFFVWYNPSYWHQKFGFEVSPNGRFGENEQITNFETLKMAVDYIHFLGAKVFLTANFRYYTDLTMPLIAKIIDETKDLVDWYIVGSPEILQYLADISYKGEIHTSTILVHYNEDAIEFFIQRCEENWLNLTRLILPREMTLSEIQYLTSKFPDIKFEVFWQSDYCRYANWLCLAEHKYFSRDLCGFVLKHWLKLKKTIRYDFKKIVLDSQLSDAEKQKLLDNSLENLDNIENAFISQTVVGNNYINPILPLLVEDDNLLSQNKDKIVSILKKELLLNFFKFVYDGLSPATDRHNEFVKLTIKLYDKLQNLGVQDSILDEKMALVKKIASKAEKFYQENIQKKGKFDTDAWRRFLLYNRSSLPIYKFFNQIPNIEVVKIPLRWRDLNVFKLHLQLIDEAIQQPEKFINLWNICGKYWHYDLPQQLLDNVTKNLIN